MKGIILAGGSGTRLYPTTKAISKQLLPIYNKPMIYYPLSTLMLSGIKDILLISTPEDIDDYKRLLNDGSDYGINISYKVQKKPNGLAEAFIIGESFIGDQDVCLILGDNIFYGKGLPKLLKKVVNQVSEGKDSVIFGYNVSDPQRYGVIEFKDKTILSIEEKPDIPKSNYAVVGLYFYKNEVINISKKIKPSKRGELEITEVNNQILNSNNLSVELLGRGYAWLDTGTYDSLLEASNFIKTIETRQGLKISCLDEIAFKYGYINEDKLLKNANKYSNEYGRYLKSIIKC